MKKYKYTKSFMLDGKRYFIRGDTLKEVYEKMALKKKQLEDGEKKIEKDTTFRAWADCWLETFVESSVSKETFAYYKSIIRCHISPQIGHMRLKSIKPLHIQKLLNAEKGYSQRIIQITATLTSRILEAALDNNLMTSNPAKKVILPKGHATTHRAITDNERYYILKVAENHRVGTFVYLMLYAGLRPAEALALMWKDISFTERYIKIERCIKKLGGVGSPKTKSGIRKVPLSDTLYNWLYPRKKEPFTYVVSKKDGSHYSCTSGSAMWQSFKKQLNIEMGCTIKNGVLIPPYPVSDDLVAYCLRHTYCTDLQDAGVPINVAKDFMGHSNISVTSKIYTHGTQKSFDNALNAINALHEKGATQGATFKG